MKYNYYPIKRSRFASNSNIEDSYLAPMLSKNQMSKNPILSPTYDMLIDDYNKSNNYKQAMLSFMGNYAANYQDISELHPFRFNVLDKRTHDKNEKIKMDLDMLEEYQKQYREGPGGEGFTDIFNYMNEPGGVYDKIKNHFNGKGIVYDYPPNAVDFDIPTFKTKVKRNPLEDDLNYFSVRDVNGVTKEYKNSINIDPYTTDTANKAGKISATQIHELLGHLVTYRHADKPGNPRSSHNLIGNDIQRSGREDFSRDFRTYLSNIMADPYIASAPFEKNYSTEKQAGSEIMPRLMEVLGDRFTYSPYEKSRYVKPTAHLALRKRAAPKDITYQESMKYINDRNNRFRKKARQLLKNELAILGKAGLNEILENHQLTDDPSYNYDYRYDDIDNNSHTIKGGMYSLNPNDPSEVRNAKIINNTFAEKINEFRKRSEYSKENRAALKRGHDLFD